MSAAAWITYASIGVGAGSLTIAFFAFRLSRRNAKVERRSEARHEAIELAEVRGQKVLDLEKRITEVATRSEQALEKANDKIALLEKVMEHQRQDAAETQRLLVINFRAGFLKLLAHLEADPVEVQPAIDYLRDALNGDAPTPRRRRPAA